MCDLPKIVFIFSGKRKSGKDYITDELQRRIGKDKACIIRLSGPLKHAYAKDHNLDYERLLDASEYKEMYRVDMTRWGEEKRNADPGFFCRLAIEQADAYKYPIWMISDARRPTDIQYFLREFQSTVKTVRILARQETRESRGWKYVPEIDDAETECALDAWPHWDIVVNNDDNATLEKHITLLLDMMRNCVRAQ